jgi:GH25 family lysozyme M1 (1,4-beta-N-acetylmuramidase)
VPTLEELHAQLDKAEALLKYRTGKVTAWSRQVELAKAEVARLKKEIADRPVPARGIDISNRQGHVDFAKVKAAGNLFRSTYPSFLAAPGQKLGDWGARFKTWPLWLASYQTQTPTPPKPWTSFVAWQYSSKGTVAGVSGAVDMNRTDDLRRLIA